MGREHKGGISYERGCARESTCDGGLMAEVRTAYDKATRKVRSAPRRLSVSVFSDEARRLLYSFKLLPSGQPKPA
jgi:hypothetical protein